VNPQAANLSLVFGSDALSQGSAEPAITLLRSLLGSDPAILRKFCGQVDYHFPAPTSLPGVTDPQERACIKSLILGVPEILFFLPSDDDAIRQAVYRLLPVSTVARDGSDSCGVVVGRDDLRHRLRPLLSAMASTLRRTGFEEKNISFRMGRILDQFSISADEREDFLP
jgi:hypothetical protein